MNAFSDFQRLLQQEGGPLAYLADLKNEDGTPLYQPHPAPVRLPLISVKRLDWGFDVARSFNPYWYRSAGWKTVSKDVKLDQLGEAAQIRMPQAWNFGFQVDHFALTPATQAYFISELMRSFFNSASAPYTWIPAVYPGFFGYRMIRVVLESDSIKDATEDEPAEGYRVYRTSFSLKVEGWNPDFDTYVGPVFWTLVENVQVIDPLVLNQVYDVSLTKTTDMRPLQDNPLVAAAITMPPSS
jgi:hypothetical protein